MIAPRKDSRMKLFQLDANKYTLESLAALRMAGDSGPSASFSDAGGKKSAQPCEMVVPYLEDATQFNNGQSRVNRLRKIF
jgi:hypothetical protein